MARKRAVDYQQVLKLWELAKPVMTMREFAASMGRTHKSIDNIVAKAKKESPMYQAFDVVDLGSPLVLEGDFMVLGDLQIPTTDLEFALLVPEIAKRHLGPKPRLIIAGDLMNIDCFSSYAQVVGLPSWQQEKAAAIALIEEYYQTFEEIYLIMGNHERRLAKFMNGAFAQDELVSLLKHSEIKASDYSYCVVETKTGSWRITHAKNYSVNQLTVADFLAQKYQQNIINHHEHHISKGWDRYKRYVIVNNGGAFDVSKMAYVSLDDSKSPNMTKGFTMLRDGFAYVFGEAPYTNWSDWL